MKLEELLTEDVSSKEAFILSRQGPKILDAFKKDRSVLRGHDVTEKQIFDELGKADPTKNGATIQWIVNMYVDGQFKLEDVPRVNADITSFLKNRRSIENKDLNSYKTLDELYDAIEPFENKEAELSGKQQKKEIKKEIEYLIDTPDFKALIPKTQDAACFYGKGTKWCTSADQNNMFDSYNARGPLIIIIAGGKKFQFQVESGQFVNERDNSVTKTEIAYLSKFPEYKELLEIFIKRHYF